MSHMVLDLSLELNVCALFYFLAFAVADFHGIPQLSTK